MIRNLENSAKLCSECGKSFSLNYSIDVAIPSLNVAIEYDCWYWHQDGEKDAKRQKEIEQQGWKFIRYRDVIPTKEKLMYDINGINYEN